MRVASIDIGTNTVLLLIAEQAADGTLVAIEEHATITRLGQDVDRTRVLAPEAIARTTSCLNRYAELVKAAGVQRIAVVGTSAMRDARGGEAVRAHVQTVLGVDARVISGDEEARVSFAGTISGLGYDEGSGDIAIFDIGGGSTEVVIGRPPATIAYAHSFDVGSVRLTERHVKSDPPTKADLDAVRRDARRAFADVPLIAEGTLPVGVAGTMTTLASIAMGLATYDSARVHGYVMETRELADVVERLAAVPVEERRNITGLEPKRADVIVAGGLVAQALLERWEAAAVRVSDRGVRWGLAQALADAPPYAT